MNFLNSDSYGAVAARVVIISILFVLVIEALILMYNVGKITPKVDFGYIKVLGQQEKEKLYYKTQKTTKQKP